MADKPIPGRKLDPVDAKGGGVVQSRPDGSVSGASNAEKKPAIARLTLPRWGEGPIDLVVAQFAVKARVHGEYQPGKPNASGVYFSLADKALRPATNVRIFASTDSGDRVGVQVMHPEMQEPKATDAFTPFRLVLAQQRSGDVPTYWALLNSKGDPIIKGDSKQHDLSVLEIQGLGFNNITGAWSVLSAVPGSAPLDVLQELHSDNRELRDDALAEIVDAALAVDPLAKGAEVKFASPSAFERD